MLLTLAVVLPTPHDYVQCYLSRRVQCQVVESKRVLKGSKRARGVLYPSITDWREHLGVGVGVGVVDGCYYGMYVYVVAGCLVCF